MASIYGRKSVLETIDAGENIKKAHILDNNGKNHKLIDKIINKLENKNVPIFYEDKIIFQKFLATTKVLK